MNIYRKYDKESYSEKLFDVAVEKQASTLDKNSGYIGVSTINDIDDETTIEWYYNTDGNEVDKDGDEIRIYSGVLDCDKYGNILPMSKQKSIMKNGKKEVIGRGLRFKPNDIVLSVAEHTDIDYEKYDKMSSKARQKGYPMVTYGPLAKKGSNLVMRQKIRAEKQADEDRKARWKARGTLYSPWNDSTKWPKEFKKIVSKYRDDKFHGINTMKESDLFEKAIEYGVDTDELAQYMSEAGSALAQAYANS